MGAKARSRWRRHGEDIQKPVGPRIERSLRRTDEARGIALDQIQEGPRVRDVLVPGDSFPLSTDVDVNPLVGVLFEIGKTFPLFPFDQVLFGVSGAGHDGEIDIGSGPDGAGGQGTLQGRTEEALGLAVPRDLHRGNPAQARRPHPGGSIDHRSPPNRPAVPVLLHSYSYSYSYSVK